MKFLNSRINVFLFLGYDIGKGLATAIDDVKKFLPQMIDNVRVFDKFKQALEDQRQRLMLEMGKFFQTKLTLLKLKEHKT